MGDLFGKILKGLVYMAAAAVMLLALLVGIARLLLPLVPEYQDDIRQWAAQATGFDVQFENISASWPFAGPELLFIDVTVSAPDDGEQILIADTLTVGVSLLGLIRDRQALLSRIGLEGVRIRARRDADGAVWIQDRPLESFLDPGRDPEAPLRLPELSVSLADIRVSFTDALRSAEEYEFGIEQMDITLATDRASIDGEIDLPAAFGARVMLAAELPIEILCPGSATRGNINRRSVARPGTQWRLFVDGEDLRLDRALRFALNRDVSVTEARGDVTISAAFADRAPERISVELDLGGVGLRVGEMRTWRYEAFRGRVEWAREPNGGWLLAGTDISVEQRDLFLPRSDFAVVLQPGADAGQSIRVAASFLRLHDLYPLIKAAENERWLAGLSDDLALPQEIFGEVQGFDLTLQRAANAAARYSVAAQFVRIGAVGLPSGNSVRFVSGTLAADQDGGFVELDSDETEIDIPRIFAAPIRMRSLSGLLNWSVAGGEIHVESDDLAIRVPGAAVNSRLRFDWPLNGDSPRIDLTANATASDNRQVVPLLPLRRFPEPVAGWLGRAIVAGRIPQADIDINGPLRAFPFADGQGVFHIEVDIADGILDYAGSWPRIEGIDATIVFDGVSLTSQRNSGRIGGLGFRDADVRIADLRKGRLEIIGRQPVGVPAGLDFLRATPVADAIGPSLLGRVTGTGAVGADLRLVVPVMRPGEFDLQLLLDLGGMTALGMTGLDWGLANVGGTLTVRNTQIFADGLTATLLDEPVQIDLYPAAEANELFGQFVRVSGRTPLKRWMQTLSLPFARRVDGPADWNALVLIPRRDPEQRPPVHIRVRSDLAGVTSRLPEPLAKPAEARDALELDIAFPADRTLEVTGRLRRDLTWALELNSDAGRWRVARGAVHAGSAAAILPAAPGIELTGSLSRVRFDDWLALAAEDDGVGPASGAGSGLHETWREAIVDIDRLAIFGRVFADVQLEARHDDRDWLVTVEAPNAAGRITVPFDLDAGRPIDIDMLRLWLQDTEPGIGNGDDADPRSWPAVDVAVADFAFRDMRFGALETRIARVAGGLVAEPIQIEGGTFTIDGNGAWLVHPNDDTLHQSRLALNLRGKNIAAVLSALGYEPAIEGKSLTVGGELTWPGGPDEGFLERADGNISMRMDEGSLLAVEPGSGRLLGVLSLAALPRRLSLDFSDVFDEGLGFDTIKGDFTIDDGNAYTCNLGMEGSVADMGVVGRTGLGARDYDQLAVVRPHVSNLLAVGGVVVGGPAAGAAMLLFSQIFRKPLSTLGESYYRVKGPWDDPSVKQIQGNDLDAAPLRNCEAFLADAISESLNP